MSDSEYNQFFDELEFDKTVRASGVTAVPPVTGSKLVTVFAGLELPMTYDLDSFGKEIISFGRGNENDIVINSSIVSREHGRFRRFNGQWIIEDRAVFSDRPSKNGLIYNNSYIVTRTICEGDLIRIDRNTETVTTGVLFVFSFGSGNQWKSIALSGREQIRIGREPENDIVLPHISVSKFHATIIREQSQYYLIDNGSTNGVIVNNQRISGKYLLHEKDVIVITNSKLIFTSTAVSYCCYQNGITVDATDVVITRGKGRKSFVTGNHISLSIKPGELVAIIGGSGAGKSTILNCMCGYLPPSGGEVFINGIDLYRNFDTLKKLIGYVPQSDIVYDNLTLYDMLSYTAKLRLPQDISKAERENAIDRAIRLVELGEKKDSFIKSLSGGQKKRASIAVELLSDPNLLFLDEPASGLDPGTERNLMRSLRHMADGGKTVILVTHSTLQLSMCDKIVFMGKGGNLCFFGNLEEALKFFNVPDVVDVYNMITDHAPEWRDKYNQTAVPAGPKKETAAVPSVTAKAPKSQLAVLCGRYMKLIFNDRQRLLLLLAQAPVLALLISLVADGKQFDQYEMTKSLLFALSCSAFWVGMLNAIQEVCKERTILKREYMTGLSLNYYLLSKIIVLGVLCLIQSFMIVSVFALTVGLPDKGLFLSAFPELFLTTFLTALASSAMGIFVSSLFTNADRAMTVAPILLMPQILFSGLIFKLDGATEAISWFAVCRWSMEGYGTTANLNELTLRLQQEDYMKNIPVPHDAEAFFEHTVSHMMLAWFMLLLYVVAFLLLARLILSSIGREKS